MAYQMLQWDEMLCHAYTLRRVDDRLPASRDRYHGKNLDLIKLE